MKLNIKALGYETASRLGIPLIQKMFFSDYVTIVMYHGVLRTPLKFYDWCFIDEGSFRSQIKYLKKNFEVIRLSEVNEWLRSGTKGRPAAVITFDDGYQNNYDVAFPILCEEKLPAAIFLTTGFIDTNDTIWSCRLHYAFTKTSKRMFEWNRLEFDISGKTEKANALTVIKEKLKKMPSKQMIAGVREIVMALNVRPEEGIDIGSAYRMLNRKAINSMASSGLIEFGAHTCSHPILSRMTTLEQEEEIKRSIDAVKEITGSPCRLFAYPDGGIGDYGNDTIRILQDSGITTAVTTINSYNDDSTSLMELRRYGIGADTTMATFKLMVHHVISFVKGIVRNGRNLTSNGY